MWLLSLARNAIMVIFGTVLTYILMQNGEEPFKITGKVQEGLPEFKPPPFSTNFQNGTYSFMDMAEQFGGSIIFVPIVGILESIAIAKAFCK